MRLALCSSLFFGFLAAHLNADTVDMVATPENPDSIHYSFTLSGFDLLQFQVLDFRFDPSVYVLLSHPLAPANFSTIFFNPSPPTPGDFLVEALTSNPGLTQGSFGIDVTLKPGHAALRDLPFFVYEFDGPPPSGKFESQVASGTTVDPVATPEPAGVSLPVLGLLVSGILRSRWRHRGNRRQGGCPGS